MPKLHKDALQKTIKLLRALLAVTAVAAAAMSLYHLKVFGSGTPDPAAGMGEAVISAALVIAFILSGEKNRKQKEIIRPIFNGLVFSLLLTLFGLSIVLLTFVPTATVLIDLCFHIFLAAALAFGLVVAGRVKRQL